MKYIKKFSTNASYNTFVNSGNGMSGGEPASL